jgi:hypothetical protein
MPSATPFNPAKLERMSLRTTPVWVRAFGPFDPPRLDTRAASSST